MDKWSTRREGVCKMGKKHTIWERGVQDGKGVYKIGKRCTKWVRGV